jgi:phosphonatase-like hydrolase
VTAELVVSDLAGTLIADDGVVASVYEEVLTRFGIPFTADDLVAARGASKKAVITSLVRRGSSTDEAEVLAEFNAAVVARLADAPEVAGVSDAVKALTAYGIRFAVTTGFDRATAERIVGRHGWRSAVDLLVTSDDVGSGRPRPYMVFHAMQQLGVTDVARVAVVGDTVVDLQSGTNAGAGWVVGVLSGAHPVSLLGPTRHTHLLGSFAELPSLLGVVR